MSKLLLIAVLYRYDTYSYDAWAVVEWLAAGAYAAYQTILRW